MASYYIAPIQSNGAGTLVNPWGVPDLLINPGGGAAFTQGVALTTLLAGDTLNFRAGDYHITGVTYGPNQYNLQLICPTHSGTVSSPITLQSYPGETVRIIIDNDTGQPVFGTIGPALNYVRFLGFWVQPCNDHTAFNVSGAGIEIGYCDILGKYKATTDNHEAIALTACVNAWVHHNNIHDLTGDGTNSAGIKCYENGPTLIEDNYIHNCTCAVNDKDGGHVGDGFHVGTYRRNWLANNINAGFQGSNQYDQMTFLLYDNVFDHRFQFRLDNSDSQIYNNLFNDLDLSGGGLDVLFTTDVNNYRANIWNNVAFTTTSSYFAYNNALTDYVAVGPTAQVAYMDYNVYTGPGIPKYDFRDRPFNLAQWRSEGHEISAKFPLTTSLVYQDLTSYVLTPTYQTAGRFADQVGPRSSSPVGPNNVSSPNSIPQIMNVNRYGPSAQAVPLATALAGPPYEKLTAGTAKSVYPGRGW